MNGKFMYYFIFSDLRTLGGIGWLMGEGVGMGLGLRGIVSGIESSGNGRIGGVLVGNVMEGDGGLLRKRCPAIMVNAIDNLEHLNLAFAFPVLDIHDFMKLKVQVKCNL